MATSQHRDTIAGSAQTDLSAENELCLRRLFEEVYSQGDLKVLDKLVDPEFEGYCAGLRRPVQGVSGLKAHAARLRSTFARLDIEVDEIRRTANGVKIQLNASGRFEREFGGIQPTCGVGPAGVEPHGPEVSVPGVAIGTMRDGQLSGWDLDWDFGALRTQN